MIAHHEATLPIAGAEGDAGTNPHAQALAQDVRTTQNAELEEMQVLLEGL